MGVQACFTESKIFSLWMSRKTREDRRIDVAEVLRPANDRRLSVSVH